LADHVEVVGAKLEHGLLHVDLERRVPEAKKARRIEIAGGTAEAPAIDGETVN
jgi:molecular chaperone IbpA